MIFRTEITPQPSPFRIRYNTGMLLIGSCFTDNVGRKLEERAFPVQINPFGVVYNPGSVTRALDIILEKKEYSGSDLFSFNDLWHSWDHHSSFSFTDREEAILKINNEIRGSHGFLKKANYLVISFGTAWVYRLKENGNLVCNCHKVPSNQFHREFMEPENIVADFMKIWERMKTFNPGIRVIFTVSPVRHWKDGAHGNQLSKSSLHLAIRQLMELEKKDFDYFPGYELLLDDLRDYRFFADDLLHPNQQAIEYIWEKFTSTYFDPPTLSLSKEVEKITRAAGHKLTNPDSQQSQDFVNQQLKKIQELKKANPGLNLSIPEKVFLSKLKKL